jgi:hypothetical protein
MNLPVVTLALKKFVFCLNGQSVCVPLSIAIPRKPGNEIPARKPFGASTISGNSYVFHCRLVFGTFSAVTIYRFHQAYHQHPGQKPIV